MIKRSCVANGAAANGSEPDRRDERAPADRCAACRVELRGARARPDASQRSRTADSPERPCQTHHEKTRGGTSMSERHGGYGVSEAEWIGRAARGPSG